jgi:hypothetical protein
VLGLYKTLTPDFIKFLNFFACGKTPRKLRRDFFSLLTKIKENPDISCSDFLRIYRISKAVFVPFFLMNV